MARKAYFVYAPPGASIKEIKRRCAETKLRVDREDAERERRRREAPVYVPSLAEWKQIRRRLAHNRWLSRQ